MDQQPILNTIIGAALGAFIAWMLIRLVTYMVIRTRLINYVITVTNIHLRTMHVNKEWLLQFVQNNLAIDAIVDGAPFYTREEFENLKSINVDHLLYLKKKDQVRITYMLANLMELEILFEGFCRSALELQTQNLKLNERQYRFMKRRSERIQSLIRLFPHQIISIDDLSENYDTKTPPKELVKTLK